MVIRSEGLEYCIIDEDDSRPMTGDVMCSTRSHKVKAREALLDRSCRGGRHRSACSYVVVYNLLPSRHNCEHAHFPWSALLLPPNGVIKLGVGRLEIIVNQD